MSNYDQPYDPNNSLRPGCICGRHRSAAEHDYEASRTMMCEPAAAPGSEKPYAGVIADAAIRATFPKCAARGAVRRH